MRAFEDAQTGAWMSELDNKFLRAELAAKDAELARVEAECDVLERVMTNALRAGRRARCTGCSAAPSTRRRSGTCGSCERRSGP